MTDPLDLTRLRALTEADAEVLFAALENPTPMTAAELEDDALYRQTVRHSAKLEAELDAARARIVELQAELKEQDETIKRLQR
jgi:septal ring factor EnvC (AmiA/AmiB activator)